MIASPKIDPQALLMFLGGQPDPLAASLASFGPPPTQGLPLQQTSTAPASPPSLGSQVAQATQTAAAGPAPAGATELSPTDKLVQALAGIEAPKDTPLGTPRSVTPQRGGSLSPNLIQLLGQGIPQQNSIPTLGALMQGR